MLIAGLASDSQSWLPIVEDLSRDFLVITLDNRGTGRTTPQDVETSIGHIAEDCMALVRHLGLSSVTLLGAFHGRACGAGLRDSIPRKNFQADPGVYVGV